MTCQELRDDYDTFALGIIDEPERSELREHLSRNCENCLPGVRAATGLVAELSSAVKLSDPPTRLRKRVLSLASEGVDTAPRKLSSWSLIWGAVAAFSAIAAVFLGLQASNLSEKRRSETARLDQALSIMSAAGTRQVSFGESPKPPRGKFFVDPGRGIVLIASNLPALEPGKTFELWQIPKGGKPAAAGLFQARPDGTALYVRQGAVDMPSLGAMAVSVEPESGVDQPTTTPIIVAPVQ